MPILPIHPIPVDVFHSEIDSNRDLVVSPQRESATGLQFT